MSMTSRRAPRTVDDLRAGASACARIERELRWALRGKRYHVLGVVIEDGWVPSTELAKHGGYRFGARLHELVRSGRLRYETRRLLHPRTHRWTHVWLYRATELAPLDRRIA
jgi:hypothetical protein